MSELDRDRAQIPLLQLAWPIFVENILRTSLMSVDTFMLSRYSERAVAAMSLVNQFAFFIQLLYMTVSTGASILITQHLGAGRRREAGLIGVGSLTLAFGFSLVVSSAFTLVTRPLIGLYHLDADVERYACQFLALYGGLSFFMAVNIGQASILRAWGHTRDPMLINVLCLVLTVLGNALCLFGPFGLPVLGVVGVAASTVFSQLVACALCFVAIRRRRELALPLAEAARIPGRLYSAILAIGIPTAGENIAYNLSQIAIMAMLAALGAGPLATYGILMAVLRYVFMPGVSIGAAAQLKVGYLVGSGRHAEARRRVSRYFALASGCTVVALLPLQLFHRPLLGMFSTDPEILGLASAVLIVAIVHEPGRNFNTVFIPALKGAGDIRFPVMMGMISMWGVGVVGAWLLGMRLGWGLPGIWIAMAADEWLRGVVMARRWRSGIWQTGGRLAAAGADVAEVAAVEIEEGI
ncbi:MAG TPA: MATE family efflux transporter [Kofleriaceae bacterium]|jgi:putative MATE family efflux protein|nr:MATE family efflux transporter [Kofleriaceae bacterium]